MDRLLYVAVSGAGDAMRAQAINAHNLANASTPGFRADLASFTSAQMGGGQGSRAFAQLQGKGVDLSYGAIQTTGRELDVAVTSDGWIAVQAADGSEAYTRRGDLHVDPLGQLTNGAGLPILGKSGPISIPPNAKLEVGADGTISIQALGQGPETVTVVDRIKLVNPDMSTLSKGPDGLLRSTELTPPVDKTVRLTSGALEASNVNTVEAMVRMIELSRSFETQSKMMRMVADNDQASSELMRIS